MTSGAISGCLGSSVVEQPVHGDEGLSGAGRQRGRPRRQELTLQSS